VRTEAQARPRRHSPFCLSTRHEHSASEAHEHSGPPPTDQHDDDEDDRDHEHPQGADETYQQQQHQEAEGEAEGEQGFYDANHYQEGQGEAGDVVDEVDQGQLNGTIDESAVPPENQEMEEAAGEAAGEGEVYAGEEEEEQQYHTHAEEQQTSEEPQPPILIDGHQHPPPPPPPACETQRADPGAPSEAPQTDIDMAAPRPTPTVSLDSSLSHSHLPTPEGECRSSKVPDTVLVELRYGHHVKYVRHAMETTLQQLLNRYIAPLTKDAMRIVLISRPQEEQAEYFRVMDLPQEDMGPRYGWGVRLQVEPDPWG